MRRWFSVLMALAAAVCGCGAPANEPASEAASTDGTIRDAASGIAVAKQAIDEACAERWTAPNRRLTRFELAYAVTDVFGVDASRLHALPAPHSSIGIRPDILVGDLLDTSDAFFAPYGEAVSELSDEIATQLVASCEAEDEPRACVRDALRVSARRLWRRNVSEEEMAELLASERELGSLHSAVAYTVSVLLESHELLTLRNETTAEERKPAARRRASRLALTLWSSVPDVELLDWAETEAATTPEGVASQVERMMADARFLRFSREFARQWLTLDREPVFRPSPLSKATLVDAPLAAAALDEVTALLDASLDAPVGSLLDAHAAVASDAEASDAEGSGTQPGLLTSRAVLTTLSSAVDIGGNESWLGRGVLIQSAFLCRTWPLASVYPEESWWDNWLLNPESPGERPDELRLLAERSTEEPCQHCHAQLETLGAALGAFDGLGQSQAAQDVPFPAGSPRNAEELSKWIHATGRFEPCVAQKLASYVLTRSVAPSLRATDRRLVAELVTADPTRDPSSGERTLRAWLVRLLAADLASTDRDLAPDEQCVVRERPNPLPNALDYRRSVELPPLSADTCADFEPNRFLTQSCGDSACHGPGTSGGLLVGPDAETTATLLRRYESNPNGPCADHAALLPNATGDGLLLSKITAASDLCGAPMPITSGPSSLNATDVACLAEWLRGL